MKLINLSFGIWCLQYEIEWNRSKDNTIVRYEAFTHRCIGKVIVDRQVYEWSASKSLNKALIKEVVL